MHSPFNLKNHAEYNQWRQQKLLHIPTSSNAIEKLFINIEDCGHLNKPTITQILSACHQNSFCFYRVNLQQDNSKKSIIKLMKQLGLHKLDANICADKDKLTTITVASHKGQHEYIPYSSKRLSWHTDGYYNTPDKQIHSMLLHCQQSAKSGGESLIIDHEIAYILLRDKNPAYIKALMEEDAMTIPANILNGKVVREAQTGPVFSVNEQGQLHMRYSARKRNIEWKQTPPILEATDFLEKLFESNSPYILRHTLKAGEGLICRNILHRRTSFVDYQENSKKRLLYRGRYFDTIKELTI